MEPESFSWLDNIFSWLEENFFSWLSENIWLVIVLVILTLLVIGASIIPLIRKGREQQQKLKEVGASIGLFMSSKDLPAPLKELRKFKLFSDGVLGFISSLMQGSKGSFDVAIFDQQLKKRDSSEFQTVILFQSDQLNLPHFRLFPVKIYHKIASAIGYEDINFDSFPKFSSQYYLKGTEEEKIRNVFKTNILLYFENHTGWSIEGLGTRLFIYRKGNTIPPEEIREFYEQTHTIAQAFL